MIYLLEDHVGFDPHTIGFPSISGCHAIVLQTKEGLYGYHSYGGELKNKFEKRATGFAGFVQNHTINSDHIRVLGACFLSKRGWRTDQNDKKEAWREEIRDYAQKLGVDGKFRGYDLGSFIKEQVVSMGEGKTGTKSQSAYVEFRLKKGTCEVYCKNQEKMTGAGTPMVPAPDLLDYGSLDGRLGTLQPPTKENIPVTIIATKSNKGELHKFSGYFS